MTAREGFYATAPGTPARAAEERIAASEGLHLRELKQTEAMARAFLPGTDESRVELERLRQAARILTTMAEARRCILIHPQEDGTYLVEFEGSRPFESHEIRDADLVNALAGMAQTIIAEDAQPIPFRLPTIPPPVTLIKEDHT